MFVKILHDLQSGVHMYDFQSQKDYQSIMGTQEGSGTTSKGWIVWTS
jgi:hypothetical protein